MSLLSLFLDLDKNGQKNKISAQLMYILNFTIHKKIQQLMAHHFKNMIFNNIQYDYTFFALFTWQNTRALFLKNISKQKY